MYLYLSTYILYLYIYTYQYILSMYILINVDLNVNNNMLMFSCLCCSKNNRFIVNINYRPNNCVTNECFEANFFSNMVPKQCNTFSSNKMYQVIFFQTRYG